MVAYGFIGTGSIAAAIVCGLCEDVAQPPTLLLSPRNAATAADLAARFAVVTVCPDNQAVLDAADVVILCLRPQDAAALAGLTFRSDLVVVSAMAGVALEALATLVAPAREIARVIPLPSVSRRQGITAVYPPHAAALTLFDRIGRAVPISDVAAFESFSVSTATIAAHCAYMATISRWLASRGIDRETASDYVASMFAGLAPLLHAGCDLDSLSREHTTPGGLNELFLEHLTESGMPDAIERGLNRVLRKIEST